MQYMLMCCFDEGAWIKLAETQKDKIMQDYVNWVESLVDTGHFRGGARLQPASSATTVRMKNGKTVLTDGPFAETKEQFGGYHLIDCTNLNSDIDRRPHPDASEGAIEVRCIAELTPAEDNTKQECVSDHKAARK